MDVAPRKRPRKGRPRIEPSWTSTNAGEASALTVLVIDDLEDAREMYKRFLEFRGMRVITAADGMAALGILEEHRPDAIVIDLAMPRLTGWEVIRAVRKDRAMQRMPILAVTGQGTRESALDAGADGFLSKPCLPDHLFTELLRVISRSPKTARDQ